MCFSSDARAAIAAMNAVNVWKEFDFTSARMTSAGRCWKSFQARAAAERESALAPGSGSVLPLFTLRGDFTGLGINVEHHLFTVLHRLGIEVIFLLMDA